MGAQAAELLASGVPLGHGRTFVIRATAHLEAPPDYDLDRVVRAHGGCGLAPHAYDGQSFTTVLPDGTVARVHPTLLVELSAPTDLAPLRGLLDLDADLTELWAVCEPWVRETGAGRQLRAGSWFEALAQALASTNTSYRSTQRMLHELVGDGAFPEPAAVVDRTLASWGYRAPSLVALARALDDGLAEGWEGLDDDALQEQVQRLAGFGPYAAASVLPLVGRPRPFVLDGWLAAQVQQPERFAALGRWAGTAMWLEVSRSWLGPPTQVTTTLRRGPVGDAARVQQSDHGSEP